MPTVVAFLAGMAFMQWGVPPIWEWLKPYLPKF